LWIAGSAGGIVKGGGGICCGEPDTDDIVTRAPLSTVSTGARSALK
jgi:hypothetical protein